MDSHLGRAQGEHARGRKRTVTAIRLFNTTTKAVKKQKTGIWCV